MIRSSWSPWQLCHRRLPSRQIATGSCWESNQPRWILLLSLWVGWWILPSFWQRCKTGAHPCGCPAKWSQLPKHFSLLAALSSLCLRPSSGHFWRWPRRCTSLPSIPRWLVASCLCEVCVFVCYSWCAELSHHSCWSDVIGLACARSCMQPSAMWFVF